MDWLISGYQTQIIDTTDNLFSLTLKGKIDFDLDSIVYPESSFKIISKDTLPIIWDKISGIKYKDFKYGILVYYGLNHRSLDFEVKTDTLSPQYQVFSTLHGIYVRKNEKYSWVFITDHELTGGPQKLRWGSIKKTLLHDNILVIHQLSGYGNDNNIFIVNLNNGKTGLLRIVDEYFCFNNYKCFNFEIIDSNLIVNSRRTKECNYDKGEIEIMSFDLTDIYKNLED